jgi:superfamily II RNA helicase
MKVIIDLLTYPLGSIIRCMRRLDELIKQMAECAQIIGNYNLKERMDKASALIKRGIVFAASLYLSS